MNRESQLRLAEMREYQMSGYQKSDREAWRTEKISQA